MKFDLTQDEANVVIQSLAKQPFEVVYQLINKIQVQARDQLQPKPKKVKDSHAGTPV